MEAAYRPKDEESFRKIAFRLHQPDLSTDGLCGEQAQIPLEAV